MLSPHMPDMTSMSSPPLLELAFRKLEQFKAGRGDLCDLPCGTGYLSMRAHEAGWTVHPHDIDPGAWEGSDAIAATAADLNAPLEIPDRAFDALTCCEGIEHIENPHLVLREFHRIVRPGGLLVVSTPNTIDLRQRLRFLHRGYWSHFPPFVPGHINAMGTFILCLSLISYGFEILDIDGSSTYGRLGMKLLSRFFGFKGKTGLPQDVNRMLSRHAVLCGRTVVITCRRNSLGS